MKTNFQLERLKGLAVGVVLCLIACGCLTHYDVTLQNGDRIRAKNKPKLNSEGYYVFKDLSGKEVAVKRVRIRQIEPVRAGSKPNSFYIQ